MPGGWGAAAAGGMAGGATGTSPAPSQRASLRGRPRLPMEARGSAELLLSGAARPAELQAPWETRPAGVTEAPGQGAGLTSRGSLRAVVSVSVCRSRCVGLCVCEPRGFNSID